MVIALKLIKRFALVGLYNITNIRLRMNIANPGRLVMLRETVAHRMNEVAFAEPYASISKQRVVAFAGISCDLKRGGSSQLIGFSWHEGLERPVTVKSTLLLK